MYSRIFVAVDDSEVSKLAINEAIKFAKNQQAKLCIVYVADEFIQGGEGVYVDFKEHEAEVKRQGQILLNEMITLARKTHHDVEQKLIEITEPNQKVSDTIITEANNWRADLIVLGTHGRGGLPRLLLGSVAEEVMRNTSIPVHIVPQQDE